MKRTFRTLYGFVAELTAPSVLIGALLLAVIALFSYLQKQLQIMRLDVWVGQHWQITAHGWGILWHALPLALLLVGIGLLLGISIGIAMYEAGAGRDYRKRLEQAEQRYVNAEKVGLERAKQQLRNGFASISVREKECDEQVLAAKRQAEAEEQRAESSEWQLARAKEELARVEARKSNAQGAAERHKRRNRRNPKTDDDDDYSGNPNPGR